MSINNTKQTTPYHLYDCRSFLKLHLLYTRSKDEYIISKSQKITLQLMSSLISFTMAKVHFTAVLWKYVLHDTTGKVPMKTLHWIYSDVLWWFMASCWKEVNISSLCGDNKVHTKFGSCTIQSGIVHLTSNSIKSPKLNRKHWLCVSVPQQSNKANPIELPCIYLDILHDSIMQ